MSPQIYQIIEIYAFSRDLRETQIPVYKNLISLVYLTLRYSSKHIYFSPSPSTFSTRKSGTKDLADSHHRLIFHHNFSGVLTRSKQGTQMIYFHGVWECKFKTYGRCSELQNGRLSKSLPYKSKITGKQMVKIYFFKNSKS